MRNEINSIYKIISEMTGEKPDEIEEQINAEIKKNCDSALSEFVIISESLIALPLQC